MKFPIRIALSITAATVLTCALCQGTTVVSCDVAAASSSGSTSCAAVEPDGAFSRASASESFSLINGVFTYTANSMSETRPDQAGPNEFVWTSADAKVFTTIALEISGPVRPGFIEFDPNSPEITGSDSGLSYFGSASLTLFGVDPHSYGFGCSGHGACLLPQQEVPITLGPLGFSFSSDIATLGTFLGGSGGGEMNMDIGIHLFQADGTTPVPIVSAEVTPEPSTIMLLSGVLPFLVYVIRRKQQPGTAKGSLA